MKKKSPLNFLTKLKPIPVILIAALLTFFFGYFAATRTQVDNDVQSMMPKDNPVRVKEKDFSKIFGNSGGIAIALESPQGIFNLETLKTIQTLTQNLEKIDSKIQQHKLNLILKDFSLEEQEGFMNFINEKSFEIQSLEDFLQIMNQKEELEMSFFEESTLNKVVLLGKQTQKLKNIYQALHGFTDEDNETTRRVKKITSLTKVDAVYAQFSETHLLENFLVQQKISLKGLKFFDYLLEQGTVQVEDLSTFLSSAEFLNIAPIFNLSEKETQTFKSFNKNQIEQLASVLQHSPKQIRVANLIDFKSLEENPTLEMFLVQKRLKAWELYESALYSKNNPNTTLMMIEMEPELLKEEKESLIFFIEKELQEVLKGKNITYYLSGDPVITTFMGQLMMRDLIFLFPLVVLIMIGFLYLSFRHWRGVALPMVTVIFSTIWTLGTIALMGKSISIVSTILPVLLVAVGSAYGIHIIHHYFEDRALGIDKTSALSRTLKEIGSAVIMAGATTIAGFGSLATNNVLPLKDFGIFTALGVGYALIISMVFIPALLKIGKAPKNQKLSQEDDENLENNLSLTQRFLAKIGHWTLNYKKTCIAVFIAILAVSIIGAVLLKVEINSIEYFKSNTTVKQDHDFIQENFAGTSSINIVINTQEKNGILNVDFLQKIEVLQKEIEKDSQVGKVNSVVDFIKKMHQSMNYGEEQFYAIPSVVYNQQGKIVELSSQDKNKALSAVILNYLDQFNRDDLRLLVNSDKSMLKVGIILKTGSTIATQDLTEKLASLTQDLFNNNEKIDFAGINPLYLEVNSLIVDGQVWSILTSVVIVLFLLAFMLRSMSLGFIGILPLGLAIIINFGLMGILGVHLDVATAIVANIAIGIGVDYTIHYTNGYLLMLQKGKTKEQACMHTAVRSGQAILINALSVAAGFLILCFSSFKPLIHAGWLIATTMVTTSFAALILVPVLLNLMKLKKWTEIGKNFTEKA